MRLGTFVIEAAEIAAGLAPGRSRGFAFQQLASFDPAAWAAMTPTAGPLPPPMFHGFDRDAGAIANATANAARAGLAAACHFARQPVSDLTPPDGPPGLVIVNPPYGARIGNRQALFGLYGALGKTLKQHFTGWKVGIVTSDGGLAQATGLPFVEQTPPIPHGSLKIKLYRTEPL